MFPDKELTFLMLCNVKNTSINSRVILRKISHKRLIGVNEKQLKLADSASYLRKKWNAVILQELRSYIEMSVERRCLMEILSLCKLPGIWPEHFYSFISKMAEVQRCHSAICIFSKSKSISFQRTFKRFCGLKNCQVLGIDVCTETSMPLNV